MNFKGLLSFVGFVAVSAQGLGMTTILLDFGTSTDSTFNEASDLRMDFSNVASGVNASLIAANSFVAGNANNHGSVNGDIRVNAFLGATIDLTLTLWDANAGNGFDTLFDPGQPFNWTLAFFDIDGNSTRHWDVVTLRSPGTFSVSDTSNLGINTSEAGQVTFSGEGVGTNVAGQGGLTPPLTQEQADAAMIYRVTNASSVEFSYSVAGPGNSGAQSNNARNLLIDGGSLETALDPFNPVTSGVPEVSMGSLSTLAFLTLIFRRRRMSA